MSLSIKIPHTLPHFYKEKYNFFMRHFWPRVLVGNYIFLVAAYLTTLLDKSLLGQDVAFYFMFLGTYKIYFRCF